MICKFVKIFAESGGLEVITVTDSRDFPDSYRTDVKLIFLDLHMPAIDGVELLRFLADNRSESMVMILSGADEDILAAAKNIATEYSLRTLGVIQKPLSPEKMTKVMDRFNKISRSKSDKNKFRDSLFRAGSDVLPSLDKLREVIENQGLEVLPT